MHGFLYDDDDAAKDEKALSGEDGNHEDKENLEDDREAKGNARSEADDEDNDDDDREEDNKD
ncbi:hypothetical protein U1Q18_018613 [Sarracenia purpurea var. burkii]